MAAFLVSSSLPHKSRYDDKHVCRFFYTIYTWPPIS